MTIMSTDSKETGRQGSVIFERLEHAICLSSGSAGRLGQTFENNYTSPSVSQLLTLAVCTRPTQPQALSHPSARPSPEALAVFGTILFLLFSVANSPQGTPGVRGCRMILSRD